ncbi:MAG: hypothetical protein QNL87_03325 [Gammaproteobacteria bacterium]|nr:hypothetical protein [Gammaproteobacteria bacterium]
MQTFVSKGSNNKARVVMDDLLQDQTGKEAGMGMGLSISRSIIAAHKGQLWADDQRQQDALFCISIPGDD